MRVPEGFQQIPGLSVCPKEWEVVQANEICSKITKGTTPPKTDIVEDGDIPFLRVNNLTFEGRLNETNELLFVSESAHRGSLARSIAYPNDILMNIVGPPLGKIVQLPDDFSEYNLNQAIIIYRLKSIKIDIAYFLNYLKSNYAQYWLSSRSKKTSGQQNLTIELCKELPVPLPSYPEQQKIAQILSTWDKAIEKLEALIAAKQKRKKALMQQLLTGKKRFAGFEGEWQPTFLGKISVVTMGSSPKSEAYNENGEGLPLLQGNADIKNRLSAPRIFTAEITKECSPGDILLSVRAPVGAIALSLHKACIGRGISAIKAKLGYSQEFLYQWLIFFEPKWDRLSQGSTFESVNSSDIKNLHILLPVNLEEQQKIATVLSDADTEIETHQKQLSALKEQKKGLMQQLLTGKKRVKVDDHV